MKHVTTLAIILRRIDYGEADRILTLITPEQGKMSILAKGVRRSKSKLAGGLELFSVTSVTYIDGRSDLKTLVSAQLQTFYRHIPEHIQATMTAYAVLQFTNAATQESCEEAFYTQLQVALEALDQHPLAHDTIEAWSIMQILQASGESLNLQTQVNNEQFAQDARYQFDYEAQGFIVSDQGPFEPNHIKYLRMMAQAHTPTNILHVQGSDALIAAALPLLRTIMKARS